MCFLNRSLRLLLPVSLLIVIASGCNNQKKDNDTSSDDSVTKLKLPPGFHAEHLYSPSENNKGSWVSMTFDNKGRLIASDQYGGMYRLELPPIGTSDIESKVKIESIDLMIDKALGIDTSNHKVQIGFAHGLVWAFNSIYAVVNNLTDSSIVRTSGFYKIEDTDNDDKFDKITLLKKLDGEQEHGPHSVKLSPDGKSFYVIAGNNTELPPDVVNYRLPPVWKRDNLMPDHFHTDKRVQNTGGWIAKVDSTGTQWELIAAGFRNPFDLAFNETGDIFTYDSDMEWDIGMPWYRPTRICHVPSGGEFGWRYGDAKWSPSYLDNLPPIVNIGQGSPTNVISASSARFPGDFSNTILAFDWSFGIIYAIHLQPDGSSYKAKTEQFVSGAPLPLTDGVIGPDGALYFLTGGRRIESHLYRVYYGDGKGKTVAEANPAPEINEANKLRRKLEEFQGAPNPAALDVAWPNLKNDDRFIRYAARIAVEHQPVEQWTDRALSEKDPQTLIESMTALAKHGDAKLEPKMLNALMALDYGKLTEDQQLDILRSIEVVLYRMGQPAAAQTAKLVSYLDPRYPAQTNAANRELSKILAYLNDPRVVEKTLAIINEAKDDPNYQRAVSQSSDLILRNPQYGMDIAGELSSIPPAQQIHYAVAICDVKTGWTPELREKYFQWYHKAFSFKGGRQYIEYIDSARLNALKSVPQNLYKHYDTLSANIPSKKSVIDWVRIMSDGGPGRIWKVQAALDTVQNLSDRDFQQAKAMFTAAACINCHTIRGEGGSIGPDLTQLGTRFSKKDILESIIDPNKTISDQYASTAFSMKDGSTILGKLMREDENKYYISQNPFALDQIRELDKKDVVGTKLANVSMMPPALINNLNPERLRDLMAYLISGGNENNPVFKQKK